MSPTAGSDPKHPLRPDHPDFHLISASVRGMDQLVDDAQGQFDFELLVSAYIDPKSLAYVALQRAMRAFGVTTASELQEQWELVQRGAALYHEAFLLGAGYQQDKEGPTPPPYDPEQGLHPR